MEKTKKYVLIFILGFVFNLVWENLHQFLYVSYKGAPITEIVLIRAAFFDAAIVFILIFLLELLPKSFRSRFSWLLIVDGFIFAVILEWWALARARWVYSPMMPIIPVVNVGLTPAIQLGLLAYLVYRIVEYKRV